MPRRRSSSAKLYNNVPVLDTGARGSTITFAQRAQGDVLIAWENEAFLLEKEFGAKFDVVIPSLSILAEPAVAVVDKVVDRKGTRAVAEEYLKYLYTEEGQDIIGKNFYRPAVRRRRRPSTQAVPQAEPVHHRPGLRRLGQGRQGALRRRRQLRPDLHQQVIATESTA
jgi:sulfate/thiosulfate-binding protein